MFSVCVCVPVSIDCLIAVENKLSSVFFFNMYFAFLAGREYVLVLLFYLPPEEQARIF